jgi:hypothetical protein
LNLLNLKKIVADLPEEDFSRLQKSFVKGKTGIYIRLLDAYRNGTGDEGQIQSDLGLNANSFYVIKSRLHDKIEDMLSGDVHAKKDEVTRLLHQIPQVCYAGSRHIARTFLAKLEKELLHYDMHTELMVVYSALKKMNLFSPRYFQYSQQYNKQAAFSISLEKSEDTLGKFCRALAEYNFSRNPKLIENLQFLRAEIEDHFGLNKSRQVGIIRNFIELQMRLFCKGVLSRDQGIEELLGLSYEYLDEMPDSYFGKNWFIPLDFMSFEYYQMIGDEKNASAFYEKVASHFPTLLLYTNIAPTSLFLQSRLIFLQENGRLDELGEEREEDLLFDDDDKHTAVLLCLYKAMKLYFRGKPTEAAAILHDSLNQANFRDYYHISAEVKLTQAFMYLEKGEFELADSLLRSLGRKLYTESGLNYPNVKDIIKVLSAQAKDSRSRPTARQKDDFMLFVAKNTREKAVLAHLLPVLRIRYAS